MGMGKEGERLMAMRCINFWRSDPQVPMGEDRMNLHTAPVAQTSRRACETKLHFVLPNSLGSAEPLKPQTVMVQTTGMGCPLIYELN